MKLLSLLVFLLVSLVPAVALAHKPSDAHVTVTVTDAKIDARIDLAVRDLDWALGLDGDGDGSVTWAELRAAHARIDALAITHLQLRSEGVPCPLSVVGRAFTRHSDGGYAVVHLSGACSGTVESLGVKYSMFFDQDPLHRGLLRVEGAGQHTAIFSNEHREVELPLHASGSGFRSLVREGIVHIFTGYDHLLFLVALLLPAVLRREGRVFRPVAGVREAARDVVQIVTAFTVAHSLTLALGAFALVSPPSRVVESAIAASVVFAALDNLFGLVRGSRWVVPFTLGLVHGFGFSATLTDLGLQGKRLVLALLGFNVGVELGQLMFVLTLLPIAYALRHKRAYTRFALVGGSVAIALVASLWFVQRAFVGGL